MSPDQAERGGVATAFLRRPPQADRQDHGNETVSMRDKLTDKRTRTNVEQDCQVDSRQEVPRLSPSHGLPTTCRCRDCSFTFHSLEPKSRAPSDEFLRQQRSSQWRFLENFRHVKQPQKLTSPSMQKALLQQQPNVAQECWGGPPWRDRFC